VDKERDYRPLLQKAMPRLWAISLNGADVRDEKPGWAHYIQPLDKGSFDVAGPAKLTCGACAAVFFLAGVIKSKK
jgi:hypothetical protein